MTRDNDTQPSSDRFTKDLARVLRLSAELLEVELPEGFEAAQKAFENAAVELLVASTQGAVLPGAGYVSAKKAAKHADAPPASRYPFHGDASE